MSEGNRLALPTIRLYTPSNPYTERPPIDAATSNDEKIVHDNYTFTRITSPGNLSPPGYRESQCCSGTLPSYYVAPGELCSATAPMGCLCGSCVEFRLASDGVGSSCINRNKRPVSPVVRDALDVKAHERRRTFAHVRLCACAPVRLCACAPVRRMVCRL